MEDRTYGVEDVERATGIPSRTLQRWHGNGWLVASATTGNGKWRRYTEADLTRARVIVALRLAGLRDMDQVSAAATRVLETLDPERCSEDLG